MSLNRIPQAVQDTVHILAKLKSRLLKPSVVLALGDYVASPAFLRVIIQEKNKAAHGLAESDVSNNDKMIFNACRKIIDARVMSCLEDVPGAKGLMVYLEVMRNIHYAYLKIDMTPEIRIELMWTSTSFFRTWRESLLSFYTVDKNFITGNSLA